MHQNGLRDGMQMPRGMDSKGKPTITYNTLIRQALVHVNNNGSQRTNTRRPISRAVGGWRLPFAAHLYSSGVSDVVHVLRDWDDYAASAWHIIRKRMWCRTTTATLASTCQTPGSVASIVIERARNRCSDEHQRRCTRKSPMPPAFVR